MFLSFLPFLTQIVSLPTGAPTLLAPDQMNSFVRVQGSQLMLNEKPFYFGGTNNYDLLEATRSDIDLFFENAVYTKSTVVRTWLFCDGMKECNRQTFDGKQIWLQDFQKGQTIFNDDVETGLGRFDYVIDSAKRHGIKLAVTLGNNWEAYGGIDLYVKHFGTTNTHLEFFTGDRTRQAYKQYIEHVLNRRNSITGVQYKNDPTIMMIELLNEPRCQGAQVFGVINTSCQPEQMTRWIDEMSTYIKKMDPNHLIAIGDEGFWNNGPSYPGAYSNVWDGSTGMDYEANAKLPNIDILGMHVYLDHWGTKEMPLFLDNSIKFIKDHADTAKRVNKPLYAGEYGYVYKEQQSDIHIQLQRVMEENQLAGGLTWYMVVKYLESRKDDPYWYYPWAKNIDQLAVNYAAQMLKKSGNL